jgi:Transposase DDE domain
MHPFASLVPVATQCERDSRSAARGRSHGGLFASFGRIGLPSRVLYLYVIDHACKEAGNARLQRQTVEHTVGTLKAWMGSTQFFTSTLERVQTEMSIHVLAYNLKRLMSMLGVEETIAIACYRNMAPDVSRPLDPELTVALTGSGHRAY